MKKNSLDQSTRTRLGAPGLAVFSGVSMYAGAAIAVGLFETHPPAVVAWLRIAAGALILLLIHRPRVRDFLGLSGRDAAVYGLFTMAMNMTFYVSINHLPLGTAVAIEFLGPISVAAWGSRSRRDWTALGLAAIGVVVISGASWSTSAVGIVFALLAGAMWAGYILTGARIAGDAGSSGTSMAVGFTWASLGALPFVALHQVRAPETDSNLLIMAALALGLGFFSSVVPYSLDQIVMRWAGPGYFAVLQAILPVVAAVVGAIALRQFLTIPEMLGVALVVAAVVLKRP